MTPRLTILALACLALSAPARADEAPDPGEVLLRKCGDCHLGTRASAKPQALAVFDLAKPDSFAGMSERQLRAMPGRLGFFAKSAEKAAVQRWVEQELKKRQPSASP